MKAQDIDTSPSAPVTAGLFASLEEQRRVFAATGAALPRPEIGDITDHRVPSSGGDIDVRLYRPVSVSRPPLLVFLHGGGWIFGDLESHDAVCRHLVAQANCAVAAVAYRLAPEHPFPAGLKDCLAAAEWLLDHCDDLGLDRDRVALGGESAGANLAAVLARLLSGRSGVRPMLQLLIHPPTDLRMTSPGIDANPASGLNRETLLMIREAYLPAGDPCDPNASPGLAEDLSGLPGAIVVTVEIDPLRDEGEAYAAQLAASAVETTLVRLPGLAHGFMFLSTEEPRVLDAYRQIGRLLARAFLPLPPRQTEKSHARSKP